VSEPQSVRERIKVIQVELRDTDVLPMRAREMLIELTALWGNCNDAVRSADAEYSVVLRDCMLAESKANRARIVAETSPAYARKREARDTTELAQEMIRSLKYYLRSSEEEMRLAR
jgi:hypothetical protein